MRRLAALLFLALATARGADPDEATLARSGIEPTRDSIAEYLRSIQPTETQRRHIDQLVEQLASPRTSVRDFAVQELLEYGVAASDALRRATEHDEPGVRYKALRLLEVADRDRTAETLYSVFRVTRAREIVGLAPEIVAAMPIAVDEHVRREARAALLVTARPEDLALLLRTAAEGEPHARMACFAAIRRLGGDSARRVLREATRSESTRIRFAAAFELANMGDSDALPVLVGLLEAEDEWIRFRADAVLRAIAGQSVGFSAGAPVAKRAAATRLWRDWVKAEGKRAKWVVPLKWFTSSRGRTLVATYTNNKVHEIDDQGNLMWTVSDIRTPWAVRGLADGHRLLSSYTDNVVYEYDAAGKRIWQSDRLPANITGLDRLANGNVIVAISSGEHQLLEIARNKSIAARVPLKARPVAVRALPNGNLLVTFHDQGSVAEVDRKGREVWRVDNLKRPYSADRLPSGNVLVACYVGRRIVEFDRDGAVVWERRGIHGLYAADALGDGSIVFADKSAVHRVRRGGEKIWSKPFAGNYLYIDRY